MNFLLTAGGALLVLFIISYLRAGRFGFTILALGVGYLLALMWADILSVYGGVSIPSVSWRDAVYSLVIITPGLLAMLFSSKQKSLLPRIVQAFLVAVLGVALLLPVLGLGGGFISNLYDLVAKNRNLIITSLLLLGIFDMVFSRSEKAPKHKEH
jgi:hypothetical protein